MRGVLQALADIDQDIRRGERIFPYWQLRAAVLRKLGRDKAADEAKEMTRRYDPRALLGM